MARTDPYHSYHGSIAHDLVLLPASAGKSVWELSGFPFELEDDDERNARRRQFHKLLINVSDDEWKGD